MRGAPLLFFSFLVSCVTKNLHLGGGDVDVEFVVSELAPCRAPHPDMYDASLSENTMGEIWGGGEALENFCGARTYEYGHDSPRRKHPTLKHHIASVVLFKFSKSGEQRTSI